MRCVRVCGVHCVWGLRVGGRVRGCLRVGALVHSRDRFRHVEELPIIAQLLDHRAQVWAVDETHGVVVDAAFVADGVDGNDGGVLQLRRRGRLVLKALELAWIEGRRQWQDLQRHFTAQRALPSFVDDAHAAAPDFLNQLEITDGFHGKFRGTGCFGFSLLDEGANGGTNGGFLCHGRRRLGRLRRQRFHGFAGGQKRFRSEARNAGKERFWGGGTTHATARGRVTLHECHATKAVPKLVGHFGVLCADFFLAGELLGWKFHVLLENLEQTVFVTLGAVVVFGVFRGRGQGRG